jgi:hypothetical protein
VPKPCVLQVYRVPPFDALPALPEGVAQVSTEPGVAPAIGQQLAGIPERSLPPAAGGSPSFRAPHGRTSLTVDRGNVLLPSVAALPVTPGTARSGAVGSLRTPCVETGLSVSPLDYRGNNGEIGHTVRKRPDRRSAGLPLLDLVQVGEIHDGFA